jgi:Sodium/hydrogen exchanger family
LNTQLGEVDDGKSWGIVVLVILTACFGKIFGCSAAAWYSGLSTRESFTLGILMNTRGLMEIIVLNLGIQNGVITTKVHSIFFIMGLLCTVITVPLVRWIYPFHLYIKTEKEFIDIEEKMPLSVTYDEPLRLVICLISMRTVPAMMTVTQLLSTGPRKLELFALRLIELGNRMSKVMMAVQLGETIRADPVMNVFRTFTQLGRLNTITHLEIVDHQKFAENISVACDDFRASMVIYPVQIGAQTYPKGWSANVCEELYVKCKCPVAIFGERGFGVSSSISIMDMNVSSH